MEGPIENIDKTLKEIAGYLSIIAGKTQNAVNVATATDTTPVDDVTPAGGSALTSPTASQPSPIVTTPSAS